MAVHEVYVRERERERVREYRLGFMIKTTKEGRKIG